MDRMDRMDDMDRMDARLSLTLPVARKTNFDEYLEAQLRDPVLAERFEQAGRAWDMAMRVDMPKKSRQGSEEPKNTTHRG